MSIAIKKISGKKYAYLAYRVGSRVVQKYLGPLSDPAIRSKIEVMNVQKKIPARFHYLFWDTNPLKINLNANRRYVIERVLELGDLVAVNWLQSIYPIKYLIETILTSRQISPRSSNFWQFWFGLKHV